MFWNTKVTEWTSISVIQCQQTKLVSAWYFWTKWHQLLYLGSCNYNLSVNIILRKWIPSMYQRNNKIQIATQHFAFVWQMVTVLWGRTSTKKKEKCTTKYARETYRIIESSNSSFNFFLGREGDEAVSLGFWCPRNVGNRGAEDLALFREEIFKNFRCHSLRKVTNINLVLTIYKYRLRFWCWSINVWQETLCDIHFNFSTTNLLVEEAKIWVIPWLHYPQSL